MQWTLGKKFVVVFGIIIVGFSATLLYTQYQFSSVSDLVTEITTRDQPADVAAQDLENNVHELFQRLLLYVRSGNEKWLDWIKTDKKSIRQSVEAFRQNADYSGHETDRKKLEKLLQEYFSRVDGVLEAYRTGGSDRLGTEISDLTDATGRLDTYLDETVQVRTNRHFLTLEDRIIERLHRVRIWSWVFYGGSVVLALGLALFLGLRIRQSVNKLLQGTRRISEKDFDEPIDVQSSDEFSDLADALNKMARILRDTMVERDQLEAIVQQLEDREERLDLVKRIGEIGVWELNLRTNEIKWDDIMVELFGFRPEDFQGFLEVIHPEDREVVRETAEKGVETGEPFQLQFRIHHARSEEVRWVESRGQVQYSDDEPELMVGSTIDITKQKKREDQLEQSLEEKQTLLSEVHHRVKNNLQIVSSMLNLQSRRMENEELKEPLRESKNRIQSMALLHETIYQSDDLADIDLPAYLENIVRNVKRSYSPRDEEIEVIFDLSVETLDVDRAIPCGLILNEAVSNVFEHAFEDGGGRIEVRMASRDGEIEFVIRDNGVGMGEDVDYRDHQGLGFQLIRRLAEDQLNGSLSVENNDGVTVRVVFPR